MNKSLLPIKAVAGIAGTRFALGIGTGLLLSLVLNRSQRRKTGWSLLTLGLLSTPPLLREVYRHRIVGKE